MTSSVPIRSLTERRDPRSSRVFREHVSRRIGESLIAVAAVLIGLGLWLAGDGGAIARFLLRLFTLTGLLFGSWGILLRWHHQVAGCLAAGALATASLALMAGLLIATGFDTLWLPWMIVDAGAMAAAFGTGARRWRQKPRLAG
jgi:hypothetical protein